MCGQSKIFTSIIKAITVYMIYLKAIRRHQQQTMHAEFES